MKKRIISLGLMLSSILSYAQYAAGPYAVTSSLEFKIPRGYDLLYPQKFGKDGIIQIGRDDLQSFLFMKFSDDMKLEKQVIVNTEKRFPEHSKFELISQVKGKCYLFVREEKKGQHTEGIAALEFFPDQLNVAERSVSLFQSSDRATGSYGFELSNSKAKCLFYYTLVPKIKRDILSRAIIGLQAFDENMNKLWGGEFETPYSEAKMKILDYTLSDDGKVYVSAKVFKNENQREETRDGEVNYHFEVLVFQKDNPAPKTIEINVDGKFPTGATIFEDVNHNIVIAGFYSKKAYGEIDGAYTVKLDVERATISKISGGYYEIPSEVIKSYTSSGEKRRLDKKERKGKDLGLFDLVIRDIYTTANGSVKIIAEEYYVITSTNYTSYSMYGRGTPTYTYDTYANDIYVISIGVKGQLEWVKKIPKTQHSTGSQGSGLSFSSLCLENDLHFFYLDDEKNTNLSPDRAPVTYNFHSGGLLVGVSIDQNGNVSRNNLGDVKVYRTNFFIRYFVKSGYRSLIDTEIRKRNGVLISIQVK
jgi:hypothetical protein